MTKQKTRTKADIPGDPVLHFFEDIVDDFMKLDHVIQPPPEEFSDEVKATWDPNHHSIFERKIVTANGSSAHGKNMCGQYTRRH